MDILPLDKAIQLLTVEPVAYPVIVVSVFCFCILFIRGIR